mgnify:CR=1 FL=1
MKQYYKEITQRGLRNALHSRMTDSVPKILFPLRWKG